jgi:hypothetical protein
MLTDDQVREIEEAYAIRSEGYALVIHNLITDWKAMKAEIERLKPDDYESMNSYYLFEELKTVKQENTRLREVLGVRKEVRWFATEMEKTLRKNDHKGGWKDCDNKYLSDRLCDEILELEGAMFGGGSIEDVIKEAVDVANFAMMIADMAKQALMEGKTDE